LHSEFTFQRRHPQVAAHRSQPQIPFEFLQADVAPDRLRRELAAQTLGLQVAADVTERDGAQAPQTKVASTLSIFKAPSSVTRPSPAIRPISARHPAGRNQAASVASRLTSPLVVTAGHSPSGLGLQTTRIGAGQAQIAPDGENANQRIGLQVDAGCLHGDPPSGTLGALALQAAHRFRRVDLAVGQEVEYSVPFLV
jgi:hypothetical protein